ncbi:hypothetical protein BXZ70DRAFT_901785 [Cristinia sonorae]|uniref:Protein-S-isoprenylcysteine O-methyltransferase n=1 Tax=Cristinia sonorae TaxID=1940300 RepID=A0A8K0UDR3_9AGAR|nr:hypothetical protein BXZ70DRAFT_901785 [Cristinia sonorae]
MSQATLLSNDTLVIPVVSTRITLLLLTGVASHVSLSPPNAPAPPKECLHSRTLFERGVRWVTFCSKMMIWTAVVTDAYATYHAYQLQRSHYHHEEPLLFSYDIQPPPNTTVHTFPLDSVHPTPPNALHPSLTPLFLLGVLSVFIGASLRLWCFRTLGRLFTFELTIRPSHTLVTSGPYSLVRHPSYTGIYLTLLGASVVAFAPGSLLREYWALPLSRCHRAVFPSLSGCGWSHTAVLLMLLVAFWFAKVGHALRSMHRRMEVEDGELRRVFGEVWEDYAEQVPWKLLPGVF